MERSSRVISRPLRLGILTLDGRYFRTGSSAFTSPRSIISASNNEVNTLVMEPISKRVSPSRV